MSGFLSSSIARKVAMALSALFLIIFLVIHLSVNLISLFSEDAFNEASHFMGTNPVIQFAMQPVLIFGVVFHFVMGFILEIRNKGARNVKYAKFNGAATSTWVSRSMIYSGGVILAFIVLHFIDFWIPEISHKYVHALPEDPTRYYHELQEKFVPIWRVVAYVVAFVLLGLHLAHGFQSAFQSMGFNNKYTKCVKTVGLIYSIVIPLGFIIVALCHHFNH
ncbi:succinate dehydrogenase cytochrome b subunit [Lutibacter holmesii]|uniref:Succinate dehydrogenase cytochrome b subunit n=1 Tax=Lutibacter holmesii TaxID=1137985 RepID=A0ABW3WTM0_9FLAO